MHLHTPCCKWVERVKSCVNNADSAFFVPPQIEQDARDACSTELRFC